MAVELVTGYAGAPHVTSAQDGRANAAAWGSGMYVLPLQSQFAITVDSATSVTVSTGDAIMQGRHVTGETPTSLTVDGGSQGMNRIDTVCIVYRKDAGGIESATLEIVKGAETSGTPSAPELSGGSILDGDSAAYMPLWDLPITGITLGTPTQRFVTTALLRENDNYTYEVGYTPSTRALKLTGANGGASSTATLPLATASTPGLVTVGSGVKITNGKISVGNASASAAGLMTAALFSKLNAQDDYVVERGSNSSSGAAMQWRWLKFNSGYAIAWGYRSVSVRATTAWGSLYYGDIAAQSKPFTWSAAPYEWATLVADGYYWLVSHSSPTTSATGSYYAVTATQQSTARSGYFQVLEFGRWQ